MKRIGLLLALLLIGDMGRAPDVSITWQTSSEFNVAGFVVERGATQAGPFQRVSGLIVAGEDPFLRHEYQYIDHSAESGRAYIYQLVTITNENKRIDAGQLSITAR